MEKSKITASIVLFKSKIEDVTTVLNCVYKSEIDLLYIVDNSPTDELKVLFDNYANVIYIHGHGNVGYGAGHNIALKKILQINSVVHYILNPDISFSKDVISKIYDFMVEDSGIGQVMPKVFYPSGELQYLCKLIPSPKDLLFKRFLPSKLKLHNDNKFQLKFTGYDKVMNVPYLSGCFMAIKTSVFNEVGLFDERFFMYPEDIDLTRRIHEKYKTIYYPEVSIIHAHAEESKTNLKMLCVHIWNMIKYFNKWGWIFDKKRKYYNDILLKDLKFKRS